MSTRDVLRKVKPKVYPVTVDGGAVVHVRALSGAGRAKYLEINKKHIDAGEPAAPASKIVALGLCEEDGTLSYDVESVKDIAELNETDGKELEKIALEIFRVSGLTADAGEEAAKKSEASPS